MRALYHVVLIWLVSHTALAAYSKTRRHVSVGAVQSALGQDSIGHQLRGAAEASQGPVIGLSLLQTLEDTNAAPQKKEQAKAGTDKAQGRAGKGKAMAGKGKAPDDDTLTHELVDQATTTPAKKKFDVVDRNRDGHINYFEYAASTRAESRVARYRFDCSDVNMDGSLNLDEFTHAEANPKELDQCLNMMIAFRMIDKNRNGEISQEELWANLGGSASFDGRWAFMIACSDLNLDGKISPMEFSSSDMYGCIEEKSEEASNNFTSFNHTDTNGDGCANVTEMGVAVQHLFGLHLISPGKPPRRATQALARRWVHCVDMDTDGCLNDKEYNALLDPSRQESQCIGTHYNEYESDMDFALMDTNRNDKVCRQEWYDWIDKLGMRMQQQTADKLFRDTDTNGDGFINEQEFLGAGEEHVGDGPGKLFFMRSPDLTHSLKTRTAWLGTLKKTWVDLFKPFSMH